MTALVVFLSPLGLLIGYKLIHRLRVLAGRAEGPLRGRDTGIARRGPSGLFSNRRTL